LIVKFTAFLRSCGRVLVAKACLLMTQWVPIMAGFFFYQCHESRATAKHRWGTVSANSN
jgi:hypothetical protein